MKKMILTRPNGPNVSMKHVQNCIMLVESLGSVFHDLVVLMLVYVKKVYASKLIKNQTKVLRLKLFTNV